MRKLVPLVAACVCGLLLTARFAAAQAAPPVAGAKVGESENDFHIALTGGASGGFSELSSEAAGGASVSGGAQFWSGDRFLVNANFDQGASADIAIGTGHPFGDFILEPQKGSALDIRGHWSTDKYKASNHIVVGAAGRLNVSQPTFTLTNPDSSKPSTALKGPLVAWTLAGRIASPISGDPADPNTNHIQASLEVGVTGRNLGGDLAQNPNFLKSTVGDSSASFSGWEILPQLSINSAVLWFRFSFLRDHGTPVPGVTGFQFTMGVQILADLWHAK